MISKDENEKEKRRFNNDNIYLTIKTSQKKLIILINKYESKKNEKLLSRKKIKKKKKKKKIASKKCEVAPKAKKNKNEISSFNKCDEKCIFDNKFITKTIINRVTFIKNYKNIK